MLVHMASHAGPFVSPTLFLIKALYTHLVACAMRGVFRSSEEDHAVSVLDLEQLHACRSCLPMHPSRGASHEADVSHSIYDVKAIRRPHVRTDDQTHTSVLDDPFFMACRHWWSLSGSNR